MSGFIVCLKKGFGVLYFALVGAVGAPEIRASARYDFGISSAMTRSHSNPTAGLERQVAKLEALCDEKDRIISRLETDCKYYSSKLEF